MKVFVIAMPNEADAVIRHLADRREETLFGRPVVRGTLGGEATAVVICGVGKSNAAAGAQLAIGSLGATAVLNLGLCGGFDPAMKPGEVFGVDRAVQYDFDLAQLNGTSVGTLNEYKTPYVALATRGPFPLRTLATGDRFSDSENDDHLLVDVLHVALRDMEGAAIAHVCDRAGVPCHAWKAVTDVIGQGSMTGQYREYAALGLRNLAEAVPGLFASIQF